MTDTTTTGGLDTAALDQAMTQLEARSKSFGAALSSALKSASVDGKSLEDVLKSLGNRLTDIALSAGLKPLETAVNSAASSLTSSLTASLSGLLGFAKGGVPGALQPFAVQPFASGGVVSAPTYFAMGGNVGLMGEAGSEAILPLKRGADGRLGVASASGAPAQSITFNVTATDAASFRKSEAQISAMLTRATARGRRGT